MQSFVERIIRRLVEEQVEFIVVGGVSGVLHGAPIVTQDLDICYRRTRENVQRLAAALRSFQPRLRGFPADLSFEVDANALRLGTNFTLEIAGESLDLLGEMAAIGGYEQVIDRTEELDLAGYRVRVLSLDDLIRTKQALRRAKDIAALPMLEATRDLKRK